MEKLSEKAFNSIVESFREFENFGNIWCTQNDPIAAAKARSYAKRITNDIKTFVDSTIKESENLPLSKLKDTPVEKTKNTIEPGSEKFESALDEGRIKVELDSSRRKAF